MGPCIDDLIVTLVVGDESHVVVLSDLTHLLITFLNDGFLLLRDDDVVEVERKTCHISHAVAEVLDTIKELARTRHTNRLDDIGNDAAQCLLRDDVIEITYLLWNDLIDNDTSYRSVDHTFLHHTVDKVVDNNLNRCVKVALAFVVCDECFFRTIEHESLALCTRTYLCDIVESENHVL